jgi:GrpB-like predicted nucleotidyltransferase (UPF0157 family)
MALQPVIIVPYDPSWPALFAAIKSRLIAAMGQCAIAIEHVGSTSVPGLAAKPIIDLDVIIARETDLPAAIRKLAIIGYGYEGENGVIGRHAFRPPADLPKHHPYVCAVGNPEPERHLTFRDHLRDSDSDAQAYATLKRDLAGRFGSNREGYSAAKTAFVEEMLLKATERLKSAT